MGQVLKVSWPQQLRSGDERYVEDGLSLSAKSCSLRLNFLFDEDISILGAYAVAPNVFVFPKSPQNYSVGLKYVAGKDCSVPCTKDIAFVLYRRDLVKWRLALIVFLATLVLVPPVIQAFRTDWFRVELFAGDILLASVPLGLTLVGIIAWARLRSIISDLVTKDVIQTQVIGERGTSIGAIDLVDNLSSQNIRTWQVSADG